MIKVDASNFVSVISGDKPVLIFFHHKAQEAITKKINTNLLKIKKNLPLLPLYEFIVDETEENIILCDFVEINNAPVLIFYKDGCFSRYKAKDFSEKSLIEFIGNKKLYAVKDGDS